MSDAVQAPDDPAPQRKPPSHSPCECGSGKQRRACCGRKWAQKRPTKPPEYLIAMRHVARESQEKDNKRNELHTFLRALKLADPEAFLDKLHKAEVEHKKALVSFRAQRKPAPKSAPDTGRATVRHPVNGRFVPDGMVVSPSGDGVVPDREPDIGEAKALELLERLLREKPWEKFKE